MANRRFIVRFAFVAAALLTLVVVFYNVEKWRGQRAWNAYRAAAEQKGAKLWLHEYLSPEVPDAENFAAIPLFKELFRAGVERRQPMIELPKWSLEGVEPPRWADISSGAATELAKWREIFVAAKEIENPTDDPARDLVAMLTQRAPALQQIRDASPRRGCHFPTPWEKGIATELPHLSVMQRCTVLFHLSVSANLALGQTAAAASDVKNLFRLHEALRMEPSLIVALVRMYILDHAVTAMWEGLVRHQWTDSNLAEFESQLTSLVLLQDYRHAMNSERGCINVELDRITTSISSRRTQEIATSAGMNSNGLVIYPTGWIRQNMVKANEYFDHVLAAYTAIGGREPAYIPARPDIVN